MQDLPSIETIKDRLKLLSREQMRELSIETGVTFTTLEKIRYGQVPNPGYETVRKFYSHLPAIRKSKKVQP